MFVQEIRDTVCADLLAFECLTISTIHVGHNLFYNILKDVILCRQCLLTKGRIQ